MTLLAAFAMTCVFILGAILDRRLLSPLAIFGGVWALSLVAVVVFQRWFFKPSDAALFVFVVGGLAFVVGSVPVWGSGPVAAHRQEQTPRQRQVTQWILNSCLLLLLGSLPVFYQTVASLLDGAAISVALRVLRRADFEGEAAELTRGVLGNLIVLSQFVALACLYELNGDSASRIRAVVAVVVALVLGAVSGTKGNAVTLILSLFFVASLKAGRLNILAAAQVVLVVLALFGAGLWAVNLSGGVGAGLMGTIGLMVVNYWIGGLVGFSDAVAGGAFFGTNQSVARFFLESARSLGLPVEVPELHAQFVTIGADQDTNTFTIYFSYFIDGGIAGVVMGMLLLGGLTTLAYRYALRGSPAATIIYSVLCVALVLTIQGEHFALDLNRLAKLSIFLFIVYGIPRMTSPPRLQPLEEAGQDD